MQRPLERLARSSLRAWTMATLQQQGMKCKVCGGRINPSVMGHSSDYVVDHCHETGQIRAVLHRSCNAALGKIDNAAGRWGAKSMLYADIVPYLKKVVAYYEWVNSHPTGLLYPEHKTDEQKKAAASLKRRKAYAANKAKQKVKDNASKR